MRRCLLAVVVTLSSGAALAGSAQAAIPWVPCSDSTRECATVPVPEDPSGATPGTIKLKVQRIRGIANPDNSAIIALAGGPGQAALPLADELAQLMRSGLATNDFLTFDQRGTGSSGALKCNALDSFAPVRTMTALFKVTATCANQIGPARALYTTAQSVADIEALRVAGGYAKLTLFGVSYGTKVAEEYAQTYPQNVASLILDSVVTPTGPDALQRTTYAAFPRVLKDLCGDGACNRATPSVTADFAADIAHLAAQPIHGTAVDGRGNHLRLSVVPSDIFQVLVAGDENPFLRAELPAALHAAREGDTAPLLRLVADVDGINDLAAHSSVGPSEDDALFLDTTCEESLLPWPRNVADPLHRRALARAAIAAVPASTFTPFTRADALDSQSIVSCLGWPTASPAPATLGPLPAVPTLIIEGQADTRTTVADAQAVAAAIPGSTLLVVPHTGHSVLTGDLSGCAMAAVTTFFAGKKPKLCSVTTPNYYSPVALPPTTLGQVKGSGRALKSAFAARLTAQDERQEFIGELLAQTRAVGPGSRVGGLLGGYAKLTSTTIHLLKASYVPGVLVSGSVAIRTLAGTLTISGPAAAAGTIHFSASGSVTGTLGGQKVHATLLAHSARTGLPASLPPFPGVSGPLPLKPLP